MLNILESIYLLFPLLGALILFLGLKYQHKNFLLLALWLNLIALILHYRASGGEILGSYFNYFHTAIYTLTLILLIISVISLLLASILAVRNKVLRYLAGFCSAVFVTGVALLLVNLWVNAVFIENRFAGTPLLQVATFNKQLYCSYKYVFYKVGSDGIVRFMCPNHYGLLPSTGQLHTMPSFIIKQLPPQLQKKFINDSEQLYSATH